MSSSRQRRQPIATPVADHVARVLREAAVFVLMAVALYLVAALATYQPDDPSWSYSGARSGEVANIGGLAGAWYADLTLFLLGYLAYLVPMMAAFSGWLVWTWQRRDGRFHWGLFGLRFAGFVLTVVTGSAIAHLHIQPLPGTLPLAAGGVLGDAVGNLVAAVFSFYGATLLLLAVFLASVTFWTGISWFRIMDTIGHALLRFGHWVSRQLPTLSRGGWSLGERLWDAAGRYGLALRRLLVRPRQRPEPALSERPFLREPVPDQGFPPIEDPFAAPSPVIVDAYTPEPAPRVRQPPNRPARASRQRTGAAVSGRPPLHLLDRPRARGAGYSRETLESMSRLLEAKLADFGVQIEVTAVEPGPVITRFEAQPAPGVKVSQITNLAKDLARALSVMSVRVVEVIPGKSVIGLEIPNEHRQVIALSEVIGSEAWSRNQANPLSMALGKDIGGHPVVVDLARMPHLLVAGTTGSGKSVGVNAMILSLLYRNLAEDVRLIMIDPKMLELSVYDGIPHLLAPVVTDMKEAANALRWSVGEMERRYRLMAALGVRNIAGFNRKVKDAAGQGEPLKDPLWTPNGLDPEEPAPVLAPLPYIVIVIDEFADMMMIVGKKVEELIARLAQKARAAGIHLILATQRPSVDVITGLIKANIPTRMAFQVSSRVDSRTILDQQGAEHLLGAGDMLYLPPGTSMPERVHGAFVSDPEVHAVVEHLKAQGEPEYIEAVLDASALEPGALPPGLGGPPESDGEADPLYDQAVRIVTETRKASISGVQRRLKIGYNRAARLVEEMEAAGVVGPLQPNGSRSVIAPPPPAD